ncbi:VOC family protein [Roseibium algae]|uniref:VOC family protein n=1 Tax=Roseibium algae TaxID=3123038 RepID=A0ABU8TFQ3_9HYPH
MPLNRITLYTRDINESARFYETHFGFEVFREDGDRIVELVHPDGGARLMLHPAAKSLKRGQVLVKLGFDVEDVAGFCAARAEEGLVFGPLHKADGYVFANAKDPDQNTISVTSRAFRETPRIKT